MEQRIGVEVVSEGEKREREREGEMTFVFIPIQCLCICTFQILCLFQDSNSRKPIHAQGIFIRCDSSSLERAPMRKWEKKWKKNALAQVSHFIGTKLQVYLV